MRSRDSIGRAPRQCPGPLHWPHKLRAWGTAERWGSGPRTCWTRAHNRPPSQYTSAAARAGTAQIFQASGGCAGGRVLWIEAVDLESGRHSDRARLRPQGQGWRRAHEPESRATEAMKVPAVGAFSLVSHGKSRLPAICGPFQRTGQSGSAKGCRNETVSQPTRRPGMAIRGQTRLSGPGQKSCSSMAAGVGCYRKDAPPSKRARSLIERDQGGYP